MPKTRTTNVAHRTSSSPATEGSAPPRTPSLAYRLTERVSIGDHAEIFKAKVLGLEGFERTVALKRILPSLANDQALVRTFIEEAKIAAQLRHENIAKVLDLGKLDDSYFVALEFIDGRDLRTMVDALRARGQVMPAPWACYIILRLCECLDYVHSQRDEAGRQSSLVRRALCPQDVMVGYEGEVKLIDVGVARAGSRASGTHPGIRKTAFGYLSPEQVHGLPVDQRSDVFILGNLLFEMLTGERLFSGENEFATLEKIRDGRVVSPTSLNPSIPTALESIVLKALAKNVEDRYQGARDFQFALESFLDSMGRPPSRGALADWMRQTFANESEGLVWDDDEIETQLFEQRHAPSRANTNNFATGDDRTIVTEPNPQLLAQTGEVFTLPAPIANPLFPPVDRRAAAPPLATSATPTPIQPPAQQAASLAHNPAPAYRWVHKLRRRHRLLFVASLLALAIGTYLLTPRSGMLQISVKPLDARLAIDGQALGGEPPFRLDKHAGTYRLAVSRPGYITFDRSISIRARQRSQMDIALQPSPDTGFALTSTPPNALVWLDGHPLFLGNAINQARTDLRASGIAPGPHLVEIKGDPKYQPWVQRFVQEPDRTVALHADLLALPVSADTRSSPRIARARLARAAGRSPVSYARKFSDGDGDNDRGAPQSGVEPAKAEDPFEDDSWSGAGKRAAQVSAPAKDTAASTGQPPEGAGANCVATISSRPWAEVSIDGNPTGKLTPLVNYALPCGKHRFTFKNDDLMIERNESITLEPGRPFKKVFMLVDTDPWPDSARDR